MQARERPDADVPGGCGGCAFIAVGMVAVAVALVWSVFSDPSAIAELEATPVSSWFWMVVGVSTLTAMAGGALWAIAYSVAYVARNSGGVLSSKLLFALDGSEPTVLNKILWFLVAALSITVLDVMLSFWGDPTPVLLWGDTRAAGAPLVLVISVSIVAAGTTISRLLFAFLKKGLREGPAKALTFFAALCLALSALAWNGALVDLARAVTVGVGGSFLLSLPGVLVFLRTREMEEQRARQEAAERRQKEEEEEEEARWAARERLERERQEGRRQEEARRARAERERINREQEEKRREQARRSKGSRESSRGGGGSRRGGGDQESTGDRDRDRRGSASPQTRTAHEVLGIAPGASDGEIVAAYREKVRMYHPDKVSGLAPEYAEIAEREMKEINAAYAKLKPKKRT